MVLSISAVFVLVRKRAPVVEEEEEGLLGFSFSDDEGAKDSVCGISADMTDCYWLDCQRFEGIMKT